MITQTNTRVPCKTSSNSTFTKTYTTSILYSLC